MESTVRVSSVTAVLAGLSLFLLLSLGLFALGLGNWMITALLAWPGAFLAQSFGLLALYVPALLAGLAWLSTRPVVAPALLVPVAGSVLPFLTLSALLQTLQPGSPSPAAASMAGLMGSAAPAFLGLLTVLELIVGALVTLSLGERRASDPVAGPAPEPAPEPSPAPPRTGGA